MFLIKNDTKTLLRFLICAISVSLITGCSPARRLLEPEPGWIYLAEGKVNHIREKDKFVIDKNELFSAIKLYVYQRPVVINRIEIMLVNGDVIIPSVAEVITAGGRSRTIELSEDGRQIERITIRYRSEGKLFSDKAIIQVGGLRPDEQHK